MSELLPDLWAIIPKATSITAAQKKHLAHRKHQLHHVATVLLLVCQHAGFGRSSGSAGADGSHVCCGAHAPGVWGADVVDLRCSIPRQAAVTRNRKWSKLNLSLYVFATAGKARLTSRCD